MSELDGNARELFDKMRVCGGVSPQEAISAMALSEAADDQYLDLKLREEGAPEEVWGKWFSLARLLRRIAVGFGAELKEDIADAIYEIAKSVDNSASLFEHLRFRKRSVGLTRRSLETLGRLPDPSGLNSHKWRRCLNRRSAFSGKLSTSYGQRSAYFASGSGRNWKCAASGFVPLPPSMSQGARSPFAAHNPRPFQPAFGSSIRPSNPLA
jgi:hypothetical protein